MDLVHVDGAHLADQLVDGARRDHAWLLGEQLGWLQAAGMAVVVIGVLIVGAKSGRAKSVEGKAK